MHAFNGFAVGQILLVFVWQFAASPHEKKFTAKQAHTHSAGLHRTQGVFGHFNVGQ